MTQFGNDALRISCDTCSMRHSAACDDCVVTFICSRDVDDAVVLDLAEERALRRLAASGLVPSVRHRSTHEGADDGPHERPQESTGG